MLDHEKEAMMDIAARPEVTGEGMRPEKKPLNLSIKEPEKTALDIDIERDGRLLANSVNNTVKAFGGALQQDQVAAISDLGTMALSMIKEFAMPRPVYFAVLFSIVAIPALPPLYRIFGAKKEEKKNA